MYQLTGGLAKLQAVLANRKYSYGGQLPSDVENQSKTQNFGNMVGGGIDAMQRIFSNSSGGSAAGSTAQPSATSSGGGDGTSGIQRYQAIASRRMGGTPDSNNFSSDAPTYDNPSSSSSTSNGDNRSNLGVASELKYQPADYKEMLPYLEKMANRNMDRDAAYAGITALTNAFGARTGGFSTVFGSYNPR